MSTTVPFSLSCPECGAAQTVLLAESANVQRSAAWRQAVLDGTFHTFPCEACGVRFPVERDVIYSDLMRGVLIGCHPRTRRIEVAELEQQIGETWTRIVIDEAPPAVSRSMRGPGPRVVFGLAELREKVVCFDAGFDDRLVEAMKLVLLEGIAGAKEAGVRGLMLVAVDHSVPCLVFQPLDANDEPVGENLVQAPMELYDHMFRTRELVQALQPDLFEGLYVNIRSRMSTAA